MEGACGSLDEGGDGVGGLYGANEEKTTADGRIFFNHSRRPLLHFHVVEVTF